MQLNNLAHVIAGEDTEPFSPQEVAFFMKKAYKEHPQIVAEILRELCCTDCEPYTEAYHVIMSGIRELGKFLREEPRLSGTSTNDFFTKVAELEGPGSDRVKSDVARLLNENIAAAESARFGKADAVEYAERLGTILENDCAGVMRIEFEKDLSYTVTNTFQNILRHHPKGLKVLGNALASITVDIAKAANPKLSQNGTYAKILGKVLGYVENALDLEIKNGKEKIEKGNEIVKFMADAVTNIKPQVGAVMAKVKHGTMLSELELPGVRMSMVKFRADIHRVVNETYRQTLDPMGSLASGSLGEKEQKDYLDGFTTFETSMMKGREIAFHQAESSKPTSHRSVAKA